MVVRCEERVVFAERNLNLLSQEQLIDHVILRCNGYLKQPERRSSQGNVSVRRVSAGREKLRAIERELKAADQLEKQQRPLRPQYKEALYKFEMSSDLIGPKSPSLHDTSSHEEIPIRPHLSRASQNLLSTITLDSSDTEVTSSANSEVLLNGTGSFSAVDPNLPTEGGPQTNSTLREVPPPATAIKSLSSDLDSGRSSGVYSRATNDTNKATLTFEDHHVNGDQENLDVTLTSENQNGAEGQLEEFVSGEFNTSTPQPSVSVVSEAPNSTGLEYDWKSDVMLAAEASLSQVSQAISSTTKDQRSAISSTDQSNTISSTDQSSTISSNDQLSTITSNDQSNTISSMDQSSTISSNDQSSTISSTDQSSTISSNDQSSTIFSNDQSSTISSTDQSSTISSNDQSSTISSTDQSSTISSTDQSSTISSNDQSSTLSSTDQSSTISSNDQSSTISSNDQSSTISSTDQSSTISSNDQSNTISSTDQSSTISSTDQSSTISSTDQSSTISSTDQSNTISSNDQSSTISSIDQSNPISSIDQSNTISSMDQTSTISFIDQSSTISSIAQEEDSVEATKKSSILSGYNASLESLSSGVTSQLEVVTSSMAEIAAILWRGIKKELMQNAGKAAADGRSVSLSKMMSSREENDGTDLDDSRLARDRKRHSLNTEFTSDMLHGVLRSSHSNDKNTRTDSHVHFDELVHTTYIPESKSSEMDNLRAISSKMKKRKPGRKVSNKLSGLSAEADHTVNFAMNSKSASTRAMQHVVPFHISDLVETKLSSLPNLTPALMNRMKKLIIDAPLPSEEGYESDVNVITSHQVVAILSALMHSLFEDSSDDLNLLQWNGQNRQIGETGSTGSMSRQAGTESTESETSSQARSDSCSTIGRENTESGETGESLYSVEDSSHQLLVDRIKNNFLDRVQLLKASQESDSDSATSNQMVTVLSDLLHSLFDESSDKLSLVQSSRQSGHTEETCSSRNMSETGTESIESETYSQATEESGCSEYVENVETIHSIWDIYHPLLVVSPQGKKDSCNTISSLGQESMAYAETYQQPCLSESSSENRLTRKPSYEGPSKAFAPVAKLGVSNKTLSSDPSSTSTLELPIVTEHEDDGVTFATPSVLLKKMQNREANDECMGVGSIPSMVTPSALYTKHELENAEHVMDYSTPSCLHSKIQQRELLELSDDISLVQSSRQSGHTEETCSSQNMSKTSTESKNYSQAPVDSGCSEYVENVETIHSIRDIYHPLLVVSPQGETDSCNTISSLGQESIAYAETFRQPCLSESSSEKRLTRKPSYKGPSKAFAPVTKVGVSNKTLSSDSSSTSTLELPIDTEHENDGVTFATPSVLLKKMQNRKANDECMGVGSIPSMVTPSALYTKHELENAEHVIDYSTPSCLHSKIQQRELLEADLGVGPLPHSHFKQGSHKECVTNTNSVDSFSSSENWHKLHNWLKAFSDSAKQIHQTSSLDDKKDGESESDSSNSLVKTISSWDFGDGSKKNKFDEGVSRALSNLTDILEGDKDNNVLSLPADLKSSIMMYLAQGSINENQHHQPRSLIVPSKRWSGSDMKEGEKLIYSLSVMPASLKNVFEQTLTKRKIAEDRIDEIDCVSNRATMGSVCHKDSICSHDAILCSSSVQTDFSALSPPSTCDVPAFMMVSQSAGASLSSSRGTSPTPDQSHKKSNNSEAKNKPPRGSTGSVTVPKLSRFTTMEPKAKIIDSKMVPKGTKTPASITARAVLLPKCAICTFLHKNEILGSGRKNTSANTSDLRAFLVEKEVFESQLRKLQVENNGLRSENKLLKEKHNRGQARIQFVEAQLRASHQEANLLKDDFTDEISSVKRKTRDKNERERQDLEERLVRLTKDLEMSRAENTALEKQLDSSRHSSDLMRQTSDRSKVIEGFRVQVTSVREELREARQLLRQCEAARQDEADKHREATVQVIKLAEMKAMLQQQLENASGGSVAEKQVQSLERRLKITEDRLHQERADRAGKLSQVEEKLINDNARLMVSEKEVKRQLQREKEKNRGLNDKVRNTRDENEQLRVNISETPLLADNMSFRTKLANSSGALATKKREQEIKQIYIELEKEEKLSADQTGDMIWILWNQREEFSQQLKAWELCLSDLQVGHKNITEGLKALRVEHETYEQKLQCYKNTADDLTEEKNQIESSLKKKVQDLVQEKHLAVAQAKNLEDMNAAVSAENESLRASLKMTSGLMSPHGVTEVRSHEAQFESLRLEAHSSRAELQQAERQRALVEGELKSVNSQLDAKNQALNEALNQTRTSDTESSPSKDDWKQQKIDKLHVEVKGLQTEVRLWQDKYNTIAAEHDNTEDQLETLSKKLSKVKIEPEGRDLQTQAESDKLALESEVREKDTQLLQLALQFNEAENELRRTRQLLLVQQQHHDELMQEMDQLQAQLRNKNRAVEKMYSSENEYQVELQSLRENLVTVNRELTEKSNELKLASVNLQRETEKVDKLRMDLTQRDEVLSQGIATALQSGTLQAKLLEDRTSLPPGDTLTAAETRLRLLEYEKETLQHDMQKCTAAMNAVVKENSELVGKLRQIKQELVMERAQLCQVTSEKVDAEHRLHISSEECDAAQQTKQRVEQELITHETQTQRVIERLEGNSQRSALDYEQRYHELDAEGKKMALELGTAQRLLEAREKEIDHLRDTIHRQKKDLDSSSRTISVLKEENVCSREDLERVSTTLTSKIKEKALTADTTQQLSEERSRLHNVKLSLERDLTRERSELERHKTECTELRRRLERADEKQRHTESDLRQKETKVMTLEAELKQKSRNLDNSDGDRAEIKHYVEQLNIAMRSILGYGGMEHSFSGNVGDDAAQRVFLRDELSRAISQLDLIKKEYELVHSNLQAERNTVSSLKEKCQCEEERVYRAEDRVKLQQLEIDTVRSQLSDHKHVLDQHQREKAVMFEEAQEFCRKLTERDEVIGRLQQQCSSTVEGIQKDHSTEKSYLTQEKHRLEDSLGHAKDQVNELNSQLRQKEMQLEIQQKTTRDFESETRAKSDIEVQLNSMQLDLHETRIKLTTLQAENTRLLDQTKQQQESVEKLRGVVTVQKDQLREQRDSHTTQLHEMKRVLSDEAHKHELERSSLQENVSKMQSSLKTTEVSLLAVSETKHSLYGSNKEFERSMDSLKTQLHEEVTGRKLAEQRIESLTSQLNETRASKAGMDDRVAELQAQGAKLEAEVSVEREKYRKLKQELNNTLNNSSSHEVQTQTLLVQISESQAEVASLQSQMDLMKQNLTGKNKRLQLDIKQQEETFSKDRTKLLLQTQQISVDLEQVREQMALKNRDNLRLQEELLSLDERFREAQRQVKVTQESLKADSENRDKLDQRNMELELLVAKLRTKVGDESSFEATRGEVSRMLADLSRRMQEQLETHKDIDSDARSQDLRRLDEYKRKVGQLESALSQEQALHIVTRTQLKSLEDDNHRLRQQLQITRRRLTHSSDTDRSKSRLEEINEIIARSQTRAQQLLASGAYGDDPLKTLSPSRDYLSSTMPNMSILPSYTPDGPSQASDDYNFTSTLNGSPENMYWQSSKK